MSKPIVQKTISQTQKAKTLALEKKQAVKQVKDKAMEKTISPVKEKVHEKKEKIIEKFKRTNKDE